MEPRPEYLEALAALRKLTRAELVRLILFDMRQLQAVARPDNGHEERPNGRK